jgi:hypothetical protein
MIGGAMGTLASIEAARPVFLIVMGISLVIFVLRLAAISGEWSARLMITGSLMLGAGYAVVLPAYEGGLIESIHSPRTTNLDAAIAWHTVRLVLMNAGWLAFGIGVAMHARIFPQPVPRKAAVAVSPDSPTVSAHESVV